MTVQDIALNRQAITYFEAKLMYSSVKVGYKDPLKLNLTTLEMSNLRVEKIFVENGL